MMEFCYACMIGVALGMTVMAVIFYCTDDRWKVRAKERAEVGKDGRVVLLPYKPETTDCEGLYDKYRVYRTEDNMPVNDCFVLRPDKDPAAKIALEVYAKVTKNKTLSNGILTRIGDSGYICVLPYKVGDVVYTANWGTVMKWTVREIRLEPMPILYLVLDDLETRCLAVNPKNVFNTAEEAKIAMKGMMSDANNT